MTFFFQFKNCGQKEALKTVMGQKVSASGENESSIICLNVSSEFFWVTC